MFGSYLFRRPDEAVLRQWGSGRVPLEVCPLSHDIRELRVMVTLSSSCHPEPAALSWGLGWNWALFCHKGVLRRTSKGGKQVSHGGTRIAGCWVSYQSSVEAEPAGLWDLTARMGHGAMGWSLKMVAFGGDVLCPTTEMNCWFVPSVLGMLLNGKNILL